MRLRHLAGYSFGASKKAVLKFPADTAIRGRSSVPVSAEHYSAVETAALPAR